MAFEPSHRSPLLTAARASEKFWVPIERMGGFEMSTMGRSDGTATRRWRHSDQEESTTTTMEGSATRRQDMERKKLQKDTYKAYLNESKSIRRGGSEGL
uniref:Uncharacterized protein n=1 Tax=Caenorhabditis tropicalis TaxID=1561998 RepID=A0A1I7TXG7_9PELO